jgi:Tfp pilus assembly protein PilF
MRALTLLALAAGLAAQSSVAVFDRAVVALSSGDYAAAEKDFREVLAEHPDHLASLQNLALVYARTDRLDQAIAMYRRALELSPDNPRVLLNLGLAHMRRKAFADALAVFQTLLRLDATSRPARDIRLLYPVCEGYLKQNPAAEGQRTMTAFLGAAPPAMAALVRCKLGYANERLDDAEDECRKALSLDATLQGAHLELAKVLAAQHSTQAAQEMAAAIRENPTDPEALYDLGVVLLEEDKMAEATRFLERSRDSDPAFWGTYFQLGKIQFKLHHADQAVPLLRKATELNPEASSAFYELGRALMAAGNSAEARQAMDRVRELRAQDLERDAKALKK